LKGFLSYRFYALVRKELQQFRRDPMTLVLTIVFPVFLLLIYGYAISTDVRHIPLIVFDQDRTAESRSFARGFGHSDYFRILGEVQGYEELRDSLDAGQAKVALVIAPGYSRDLQLRRPGSVQLVVDGSDSNTANIALSYASQIAREYAIRVTVAAIEERGAIDPERLRPIELRPRILYNPELRSTLFFVPGLIGVIMMFLTAVVTAGVIVRERERGTIEQILVTPLSRMELLLGKIIPFSWVTLVDVMLIIGVGTLLFGVPLKGSLLGLMGYAVLFLFSGLGIGLFVSTVARTQQGAFTMAVLVSLLPSIYLSGFIFPIASMPAPLQWIAHLSPATYFLQILRGEFLKGIGFQILWPQALFLAAFSVFMMVLNVMRFKKYL